MEKKIIHGFLVTVGPSIYTNRPGKTDIRIDRETEWGGKHENGLRYSTAQVWAAEDFEILRNYHSIQGHVMSDILEYARSVLFQTPDIQEVIA